MRELGTYNFEQGKRFRIDDDLFQTLLLLKDVGRMQNMTVMINNIIAQFLTDSQGDIDFLKQSFKH